MPSGYKFVIADDHPLFRGALKQALLGLSDVATILEAGDFEGAKSLVAKNDDIDLVLLDLTMPGCSRPVGPDLAARHPRGRAHGRGVGP